MAPKILYKLDQRIVYRNLHVKFGVVSFYSSSTAQTTRLVTIIMNTHTLCRDSVCLIGTFAQSKHTLFRPFSMVKGNKNTLKLAI